MAFATDALRGRASTLRTAHTGPIATLLNSVRQWREFRATRNELSALSNRALADLGLHRGEITAVATRAVYGHRA